MHVRESLCKQTETRRRVDADLCIKICDFGFCRCVGKSGCYTALTIMRELPLRWLPPEITKNDSESLHFTLAVDVV